MKRVVTIIDSLLTGGAQRQMVCLSRELSRRHEVTLVTYHPMDDYAAVLAETAVRRVVSNSAKWHRFLDIRRTVRQIEPACIIGYLTAPNLYGLIASLGSPRIPVIVSERSSSASPTLQDRARFEAYRLADAVVTNSLFQRNVLRRTTPTLADRVVHIPNCVDLDLFAPTPFERKPDGRSRLVVAGTIRRLKNTLRLAMGLRLFFDRHPEADLCIDWFGRVHDQGYFDDVKGYLKRYGLEEVLTFRGEATDMHNVYGRYDSMCLPSVVEGCANAVCEAMACGLPVMASAVGDNPWLLGDDRHNVLFSPESPVSIAEALSTIHGMPPSQRRLTGEANRRFCEKELAARAFGERYEAVMGRLV